MIFTNICIQKLIFFILYNQLYFTVYYVFQVSQPILSFTDMDCLDCLDDLNLDDLNLDPDVKSPGVMNMDEFEMFMADLFGNDSPPVLPPLLPAPIDMQSPRVITGPPRAGKAPRVTTGPPRAGKSTRANRRANDDTAVSALTMKAYGSPQVFTVRRRDITCHARHVAGRHQSHPPTVDRVLPGPVGGPPVALRWNNDGCYSIAVITQYRRHRATHHRLAVRFIGTYATAVEADVAWEPFGPGSLSDAVAIDHVYQTVVQGIYGCFWRRRV